MGVPKFYRFISERYPLINAPLSSSAAPKIDNLYLDMNGIIHNCVRGTPGQNALHSTRFSSSVPPATKSTQQIFLDVFKYIDNIVALLPPRRVLYMAIDGVAPRAKMNQQRARRFRSAKERLDEHKTKMDQDPMYAAAQVEPFDSNCITPGTQFMFKLTEALKYFVAKKLTEDVNWANVQVILSGAEAPGEGEHKIMAYIRTMRESGQLPANTRHCVYGLDADLIMLGLVTHEPHFFILREKVDFNFWRKKGGPRVATALDTTVFGEFELLSIGLLREYLVLELGADGNSVLPYFDIERIMDDFVFIIMLIGNDFLPNLPTLDIAGGTLQVMLHLYKRTLPLLGGYLTEQGRLHGTRLEYFFGKLGLLEEDVLRQRLEDESSANGRRNRRGAKGKTFSNVDLDQLFGIAPATHVFLPQPLSSQDMRRESLACREEVNRRISTLKKGYYSEKFGLGFVDESHIADVTKSYVEGVAWTLKYYTEGCRQWRWFYPEHYAPLASDIRGVAGILDQYETEIEADKPFRPFEQLLSVLPPVSSWCLPAPYRILMTSPASPLRDQYPEDFRTDMNGKRNDWEAVVLLPFIDEDRLLQAIRSMPSDVISGEELIRNNLGPSFVYHRDPSATEVMESPFGSRMPAFVNQTKRESLVLPSVPSGKPFTAALLPGTKAPKSSKNFADLPTLNEVEHSSELKAIGVNVFGTPSRSDSLVLTIDFDSQKTMQTGMESNSDRLHAPVLEQRSITVGSLVWCGYPWRIPGSVEHVANELITKSVLRMTGASGEAPNMPRIESRKTNKQNFATDVRTLMSSILQRHAVSVSTPKQIVAVRPEQDLNRNREAKSIETVQYHEHFLSLRTRDSGDSPHNHCRRERLGKGQTVLFAGHGSYFGHRGTVVSKGLHGVVRILFEKSAAAAREPAFGYRVVSVCATQERWMPLSKFASAVGMRIAVVDQFLGSFRVRLSSGKDEIDLGLGVKYIGRGLYVPGYARRDERSHFLFSRRCADLLRDYHDAFPTLFAAVDKMRGEEAKKAGRSRGVVVYEGKDLFPNLKKPDETARTVSAWLSAQDVASLPLVSISADVLTRDAVVELEKHCSIVLELQREFDELARKGSKNSGIKDVDLESLLTGSESLEWDEAYEVRPATSSYHTPVRPDACDLRLGDRVVNRMGSGGVPLGLRGTVVGIHHTRPDNLDRGELENQHSYALVEVCFDEGFIGGGGLGNRCSKGRGKAVPAPSLFIIRPDRDNSYYVKNYAQVAARVGHALKQNGEDAGHSLENSSAIANAAVQSYATAVKKKTTSLARVPEAPRGAAFQRDQWITPSSTTEVGEGIQSTGNGTGNGAATGESMEARPEFLPLPSFVNPRQVGPVTPGQQGIDADKMTRSRSEQVVSRDEPLPKEKEFGATINGALSSDPGYIEGFLKKALENVDIGDDRRGDPSFLPPRDIAGRCSDADNLECNGNAQEDIVDEDEFAAVWRELQSGSGKLDGS